MDLSLDGIYRAAVQGIQWGFGSAVITYIANISALTSELLPISTCSGFVLGTLLGFMLGLYYDTQKVSLHGKGILITGCDSGFGYELALRLEKKGSVVFAGCLNSKGEGAEKLRKSGGKNLHVLQLDVTSDAQIASALQYITENAPPQGLWGIVNNAGISTFGLVEWVPLSTCYKLMEINVWGMLRVIKAFLPLIRQSKGRIVNIASGLGRCCNPNRSTYGITKFGVEALSDCLRFEMRRWGVDISIIEPGNFTNATGIFTRESITREAEVLWNQIPEQIQKDYTKKYFDDLINVMKMYCTTGETSKEPVLESMTQALTHKYPHPRYQPMEPYFKIRTWVNTHLPELPLISYTMDLSLDGVYRAVVKGLQVGFGTAATIWIAQLFGLMLFMCPCHGFLSGAIVGTILGFYIDTIKIPVYGKAILITGCDTGFGHALALRLASKGAIVFAGCLKSQENGAEKLCAVGNKNLHVVQLDVTSDEQVQTAFEYVSKNLPSEGLWGIINNAGWSTFGHVEWVPLSLCKKSHEVNVWGMLRVIRCFLPLIRQSKGRIINMSSGMGRRCAPSRSSYCIVKYGVEALSDCLRFEMRSWGVDVIIMEPGNFVNATGVFTPESIRRDAAYLWEQIPEAVQKAYTKEYFDGLIQNMIKYSTLGTTDKEPVLQAFTLALEQKYPHPRYQPMELYFKLSVWVNTHLPEWVFETFFT